MDRFYNSNKVALGTNDCLNFIYIKMEEADKTE